jgi:hypothetical protein
LQKFDKGAKVPLPSDVGDALQLYWVNRRRSPAEYVEHSHVAKVA